MEMTITTDFDLHEISIALEETNKMYKATVLLKQSLEEFLKQKNVQLVEPTPTQSTQDQQCDSSTVCLEAALLRDHSYRCRGALSNILGWSHLMLKNSLDEVQQQNALETIHRNAQLLYRLIQDFEKDVNL